MKITQILPPDDTNLNAAPTDAAKPKACSTIQWGLLVVAVALVLGLTPWFLGVGWMWTIGLALGALALWQSESDKMTLPPWFAPFFALLVAAHAFRVLDIALIPLLWVVAACLLCRGVWNQSKREPSGLAQRLKTSNLWRGHRAWVTLGCALSLLSLAQTWGQTPTLWNFGWTGGMQTQMGYSSSFSAYSGQYEYSYGPTLTYNPMMYMNNMFFSGIEYSGRWQPQVTWTIVALLFVLGWSTLQRDDAWFRKGGAWVIGCLVFAALWWFGLRNDAPGPRWFLVGLLMTAFGVWKLRQGEESGAHDPKSLLRHLKLGRLKKP